MPSQTTRATLKNGTIADSDPAKAVAGSLTPCREIGELDPADNTSLRAMEFISGEDFVERVISFNALYESMLKCVRGTLWKTSVSSFYLNGTAKCLRLESELRTGKYKPKVPKHFILTHPKRRECCSIGIRDRVYQRSLNDNVVYPLMTKSLIKANCACQKGKGTDFARDLFVSYLRKHYHHYGLNGYALQLDIKGYYPNMSHDVAKDKFRKHLPPEIFDMVATILDTQYQRERGYEPGSQLVQIAGICVLDGLDHFIKERLRVKYYVRYMDDMVIVSPDRDYLKWAKGEIERYLACIGYELNHKKTRITSLNQRTPFLGFTYQLTATGKIIKRIRPEKLRAEKRKLRRMVKLAKHGRMTREKVDECFRSWYGYVKRNCTGRSTAEKIKRYYENLWSEL